MTTYNVGSDHSGGDDNACIDAVCQVLESAGHTVNKLGVDSNLEAKLNTGNKEDIGVFIVNGACLGTFLSCNEMVQGGGCGKVFFGFPKPLMSGSSFKTKESLSDESKKLKLVQDGSNWKQEWYTEYDGKYTVDGIMNQLEGVSYAWGETCEEVAQGILNGDSSTGETTTTKETSIMSGWESITDLLKPLDGEAMVVVRGDTVVVKKIDMPESTKLWVYEGINVVDDSVKVSDYSPEIYNTFTVKWGESFEYEMEVTFEKHKELFGERKTEVNAVYEVPYTKQDTEQTDEQSNDTGDLWGWITNFFIREEKKEEEDNAETDNLMQSNDSSESEDENKVEEIAITTKEEAYRFALKTLGKEMRKSGHKIECKVIGNKRFEIGEWCKVYLPSFNEECIMFISKVSHNSGADNEWLTSLTLVDYPPSLGNGQSNKAPTGGTSTSTTGEDSSENSDNTNQNDNNSSENNGNSDNTNGGNS